jgi:hypothetical protein
MAIRKFAAVAIAATLVFGTAGCTFTSPVATRQAYSPSDGGQVDLETVKARNFIYLSNGTQAALFGSLVNSGLQDAEVHLQYTDATLNEKKDVHFVVKAGKKLDIGYNGEAALGIDLNKTPGSIVSIFVGQDSATGKEIRVPVLDGTLSEYAPLVATLNTVTPAAGEADHHAE